MTYYAVVIADPTLAQTKEIERNVAFNLIAHRHAELSFFEQKRLERHVNELVTKMVGPKRETGDLYDVVAEECPDGLPNCRNCGDPDHALDCKAKGHCPYCGTRHGIAFQAHVDASGYRLIRIPRLPEPGQQWDRSALQFLR